MCRHCGMEAEKVRQLCEEAYVEMATGKVKVYNLSWNVVGRKPEDAAEDLRSEDEEDDDDDMEDVTEDDGESGDSE